jgi:hypothetical protein
VTALEIFDLAAHDEVEWRRGARSGARDFARCVREATGAWGFLTAGLWRASGRGSGRVAVDCADPRVHAVLTGRAMVRCAGRRRLRRSRAPAHGALAGRTTPQWAGRRPVLVHRVLARRATAWRVERPRARLQEGRLPAVKISGPARLRYPPMPLCGQWLGTTTPACVG